MEITRKLRERFCKDYDIPIKVFDEPYFSSRLKLFDKYFNTCKKWNDFLEELEKYSSEEEFFDTYNGIKDKILDSIQESGAYTCFNTQDMNVYAIKNQNISSNNVYKDTNIGRKFISIDMVKANFSALNYFDSSIFKGTSSWDEFVRMFTDSSHIIKSKNIRQVVLGKCNSKRHATYEKYLMDLLLTRIKEANIICDVDIVAFMNDELVIDITHYTNIDTILAILDAIINISEVPYKIEVYTLKKVCKNGYMREFIDGSVDFKGVNSNWFPFVLREVQKESLTDEDYVFSNEGVLCKYLESPMRK